MYIYYLASSLYILVKNIELNDHQKYDDNFVMNERAREERCEIRMMCAVIVITKYITKIYNIII